MIWMPSLSLVQVSFIVAFNTQANPSLGHGAPAVLSHCYLEGTYSEVYPNISEDVEGMQRFFKQFSFPGGIGSHATPETPGSLHEGGELGYSLSHAFGTVYDHPNLIALTMIGDGESVSRCEYNGCFP